MIAFARSIQIAGSAGDQNAPQLIIENRAVMLDYARPDQNPGSGWAPAAAAVSAARDRPAGDNRAPRTDWLCESCGCQNFARRMECYKCNMPRGENAVAISALLHGEPQIDLVREKG